MKQYKDELLVSCLGFILSLPHDIIELDIRAYVPALQVDTLFQADGIFFFHIMFCVLENTGTLKVLPLQL